MSDIITVNIPGGLPCTGCDPCGALPDDLQVTITDLTVCGCRDNGGGLFYSLAAITAGIIGTHALTRTSATTWENSNFGTVRVDTFSGSCGGSLVGQTFTNIALLLECDVNGKLTITSTPSVYPAALYVDDLELDVPAANFYRCDDVEEYLVAGLAGSILLEAA